MALAFTSFRRNKCRYGWMRQGRANCGAQCGAGISTVGPSHGGREPTETRKHKSKSASRDIPLLGVSFEAMRLAPDGFPKFRDNGSLLPDTLMKYFEAHDILETPEHRIYSHATPSKSGCWKRS